MNGSRARKLRAMAVATHAGMGGAVSVQRLYRRFKRDWTARKRRYATVRPPAQPRRSMDEQGNAARKRGAAEAAERRQLFAGDGWLAAQPWMTIQRLRRVAAMRKAVRG